MIKTPFLHRLSEMFVPLLTWALITFPLWMSPFHPAIVAYFIIAFDLYFFYRSITNAVYATISYQKILAYSRFNFAKKLLQLKKSAQIKHFIIIPNYREPLYKLEETINTLVNNDFPYKKENLHLVLAFEEREGEAAKKKADYLLKKYQKYFCRIITTYHYLTENEIIGKASNQTFAAKIITQYVKEHNYQDEDVLITICDADSHLAKNYFSYLTCCYLKDKDRLYHFYWAPVLLYNNFWQVPFFVRMQSTLSSILRLSLLSQKENLIQISTYSTNLWLIKQINYWDTDVIPEDWHIYFQAFFTFGQKVKTIPLYTLTTGDAVYAGGLIKTLINRYEQEKRWAWGVSDISYTLKKLFTTPHINFLVKLRKIIYLTEGHLLWPTSFFILTISASIPPLINPSFKRTVLGYLLPQLSGLILTLATSMLILYTYLDIKVREKIKMKFNLANLPLIFIQWYFLPLVSFIFSSLPALDAHTRLLFNKKIEYKVTEKV
jgi:hypothetical protein